MAKFKSRQMNDIPIPIVAGAAFLGLLILYSVFTYSDKDNTRPDEEQVSSTVVASNDDIELLQAKVLRIEEEYNGKISRIETRIKGLEMRLDRIGTLEDMEKSIPERIDALEKSMSQKVESLKTQLKQYRENIRAFQKKEYERTRVTTDRKKKITTRAAVKPVRVKKTRYHMVTPKETLYSISRRYGISIEALRKLNKLKSDEKIHPDQKLIVSP
ncbi:LysM domain-containing protein [Desulfobacterales bacterium HSG16]|nr:LysM domain-containing protein [Desulfobacterales bacterium HSG16]